MATRTEQLLSEFRNELNRLAPAVELVDGMSGYVEMVRERADTIRKEAERILKNAEETSQRAFEDSRKTLEDFSEQRHQELEPLITSLAEMLKELNRLVDFLKNADVPGRIDRTEIRIENLNTSVQNLHSRLDFLELNLREEHKKTQGMTDAIAHRIKGFKNLVVILLILNLLMGVGALIVIIVRG